MAFFKKFKVLPDLPEKLRPLEDIASNLWMAWNPEAIRLFIRLDTDQWERTQHNPVRMLAEIGQDRLDELTQDEGFVAEVENVWEKLKQYLNGIKGLAAGQQIAVAYFSAEFGLNDSLPMYSGGLGILSGDYVKSASDLNLSFTGIGILYQQGYFQQYLNSDGWQQDFYQTNDFPNMQVFEVRTAEGQPVSVELNFPGRKVFLKVWELRVGRIKLYMLDANIDPNSEADRALTAQLYGGDKEIRLQQEIILGIGGIRMLDQLGIGVQVVHMNEGHSAFTPFERARILMKKNNLTFSEAIELARKTSVFTTHTNVPAGLDAFDPNLLRKYFGDYVKELGISFEEFLACGRFNAEQAQDSFSMTVAAIKNSSYVNGVSHLHAAVARNIWKSIWNEIPDEHVPIQGITNGIHIPTWISFELNDLFERYLGVKWREKQDSRETWERIQNIPDPELWTVHEIRRRRLIAFTRQRLKKQLMARGASNQLIAESQEALNPQALTIGFARRFAAYKRGNLIFMDPERLMSILNHAEKPVQLIIAGKAHPQDQAGKELIKNIVHFINSQGLGQKIVFIEDYDINVARYMVQGVDVWLNTPQRPLEACGTSGMKAACNGGLNLSVLDGWWDEAFDSNNGWAIGNREIYQDKEYQNQVESRAIYSTLENDIIPLFYSRGSDGLPREWIAMVKNSLRSIASHFNTNRMIKNYFEQFYQKAAQNFDRLGQNDFTALREFVRWRNRIKKDFSAVRIEQVVFDSKKIFKIGEKMMVQAVLILGKNQSDDIRVDVYYGSMTNENTLGHSNIERLTQVEKIDDNRFRFSGHIRCERTGSCGFRLRITPYHPLLVNPYELGLVIWD